MLSREDYIYISIHSKGYDNNHEWTMSGGGNYQKGKSSIGNVQVGNILIEIVPSSFVLTEFHLYKLVNKDEIIIFNKKT